MIIFGFDRLSEASVSLFKRKSEVTLYYVLS